VDGHREAVVGDIACEVGAHRREAGEPEVLIRGMRGI
jgi:hypothetical protein